MRFLLPPDAPRRLALAAVAAILVAVHVDRVPSSGGADDWPWRNAVVVLFLPLLAVSLTRRFTHAEPATRSLRAAFGGLLACVVAGSLWSPYPQAAWEQIAYIIAYGALFLAVHGLESADRGTIARCVAWAAASSVLVGILQVAVFANPYGFALQRFTSFTAPQYFGLSLPILLALLLANARLGRLPLGVAVVLGAALLVTARLNGGRQEFVAALALVIVGALPDSHSGWKRTIRLPAAMALVAVLACFGLRWVDRPPWSELIDAHPVSSLLAITPETLAESGDAGTARDRWKIWSALGARLAEAGPTTWTLGHGTAASGIVIAEGDVRYRTYDRDTMDPNRTAHNEFLRSLFEWGLIGAAFYLALVAAAASQAWRRYRTRRHSDAALILAATLVATVGYSFLGNLLAASGSPLGVALVLLYAHVFAADSRSTS